MNELWVTNHALTKGVIKVTNPKTTFGTGSYDNEGYYVSKEHCHKTEEEAREKAEKMRIKRISTLLKTLSRLESMSFI